MRRGLAGMLAALSAGLSAGSAIAGTPTHSILHSDTRIELRSDGGRYLAYQNDRSRVQRAAPDPVSVAHTRAHVFFGVPTAEGYELYVAPRP